MAAIHDMARELAELRARAEKAEDNLKSAAEAFDELSSGYLERAQKAEADLKRLREGIAAFRSLLSRWIDEHTAGKSASYPGEVDMWGLAYCQVLDEADALLEVIP